MTRGRRIAVAALALHAGFVAYATLGPDPGDRIAATARELNRVESRAEQAVGRAADAPSPDRIAGIHAEDLGNVVLFLPFGLLLPVVLDRRRWLAIPIGVGVSLLVEGIQLTVATHRSAQWNDVVTNAIGVVLGFALWWVASRLSRPRIC